MKFKRQTESGKKLKPGYTNGYSLHNPTTPDKSVVIKHVPVARGFYFLADRKTGKQVRPGAKLTRR